MDLETRHRIHFQIEGLCVHPPNDCSITAILRLQTLLIRVRNFIGRAL